MAAGQLCRAGAREMTRVSESQAQAELSRMKAVLDRTTFYPGIFVDDIDLSGKTLAEARQLFTARLASQAGTVAVTVRIDDQEMVLNASDIGFTDNAATILEQAWQIGRQSSQNDEYARVAERYAVVVKLQSEPIHLTITPTYDSAKVADRVMAFAQTQQVTAEPARATSFDPATGAFTVRERVIGRSSDPVALVASVLQELHAGHFQTTLAIESERDVPELTAADIQAELTLLGTATTYAYKVDPARDQNLAQACAYLNGTLVQPGEVFSFNQTVGKRTIERGFQEAGAITDGNLVKAMGGGVCQVNTTLMQAAMKSDYELVERSPHSWPSSYTTIGLDATVDWGGPDFKFRNNSDFPVGIVAFYEKPRLTVKIYGRRLEEGVSISLRATRDETIPVAPPLYRQNDSLAPGQIVQVRPEHIGQRATAYKVYTKNGQVIREKVLFKSYYRPIQGIYEIGPAIAAKPPSDVLASSDLSD
jgi:vancomycin resistance protein YoaR